MIPRTKLVARCCNSLYSKWQGAGIKSFAHEICCHCKKPLAYARSKSPSARRRVQLRRYQQRRRDRLREQFRAQGMTMRGTPRKYKLHDLGGRRGRARKLIRERIYRTKPLAPLELAWKEFRAAMGDITIPEPGGMSLRYGKDLE